MPMNRDGSTTITDGRSPAVCPFTRLTTHFERHEVKLPPVRTYKNLLREIVSAHAERFCFPLLDRASTLPQGNRDAVSLIAHRMPSYQIDACVASVSKIKCVVGKEAMPRKSMASFVSRPALSLG